MNDAATTVDLSIELGRGLVLQNPVSTASGTYGKGLEFQPFYEVSRLGSDKILVPDGTTLTRDLPKSRSRSAILPQTIFKIVADLSD